MVRVTQDVVTVAWQLSLLASSFSPDRLLPVYAASSVLKLLPTVVICKDLRSGIMGQEWTRGVRCVEDTFQPHIHPMCTPRTNTVVTARVGCTVYWNLHRDRSRQPQGAAPVSQQHP